MVDRRRRGRSSDGQTHAEVEEQVRSFLGKIDVFLSFPIDE